MKRIELTLLLTFTLLLTTPALISQCQSVGGVVMTNIGAINGNGGPPTNLGPAFTAISKVQSPRPSWGQDANGNFRIQPYWVNSAGETILFDVAILKPVATSDPNVVAVLWGNYPASIIGGTGKYKNAKGNLDHSGIADFSQNTLVLRYRGTVCLRPPSGSGQ